MSAPIPNVSLTFPEDGLGIAPQNPANIFAVFGASSAGTVATPTSIGGQPSNVVSGFGYGPAPSLAAALIQSGASVVFVKVTHTNGTVGTVTDNSTVGLSVMTVTGNPFDRYDVVVTVTRSGTAGSDPEPGFTVSLDGGLTVSGEIRMPTSRVYSGLAATTGLTLNFTAATMVAGESYTFSTTAPTVSAANVATAIAALKTSQLEFSMGYVCGGQAKAGVSTIADAVATLLPKKKFCRFFCEAVDADSGDSEATWMSEISADFAGFESSLMVVAAGYISIRDLLTGASLWRSVGHLAAVRAAMVPVSRDLAKVSDGSLRPYKGASAVNFTAPTGRFVHDEELVPGLNAERFLTIRSLVGYNGAYITNPNLMSGPTSDYDLLQFGRIADAVARNTNTFFTGQLSRDLLLNPTTGKILEKEAKSLEAGNDSANRELVDNQEVSALRTTVSRADNITTTRTLTVSVACVPKGYLKTINITFQFTPSLGAGA